LRSQQLFESVLPVYKGTEKDETINYYIAQCNFLNEDYTMASYYLKSFVNNFPTSDKAEECRYLTGFCYYKSSPKYSLDQEYTKDAIEEFQIYLNKYPKGEHVIISNQYIAELRKKLEIKAFSNSKLYFDMQNYKAATITFKNFLNTYPDSDFREETMFLIVKSGYLMAENSIALKQFERYESVISDYEVYVDEYPTGKHVKDAEKYFTKSQEFIKKSSL
jgi:outer membrane protein assembly factor BamD